VKVPTKISWKHLDVRLVQLVDELEADLALGAALLNFLVPFLADLARRLRCVADDEADAYDLISSDHETIVEDECAVRVKAITEFLLDVPGASEDINNVDQYLVRQRTSNTDVMDKVERVRFVAVHLVPVPVESSHQP